MDDVAAVSPGYSAVYRGLADAIAPIVYKGLPLDLSSCGDALNGLAQRALGIDPGARSAAGDG